MVLDDWNFEANLGLFDELIASVNDVFMEGSSSPFPLNLSSTSTTSEELSTSSTTSPISLKYELKGGYDEANTLSSITDSVSKITFQNKRSRKKEESIVDIDEMDRKKPKKQYYIRANPFPRILKRDIRRDYGRMFANVMNSTDVGFVQAFFCQIAYPDCGWFQYEVPELEYVTKPYSATIKYERTLEVAEKLDYFIQHTQLFTTVYPDFIVKLNEAQIVQKEGVTGSKVVLNTQMCGTNAFAASSSSVIGTINCSYCDNPLECICVKKCFASQQLTIVHSAQIIFHLDELHRMHRCEFVCFSDLCD